MSLSSFVSKCLRYVMKEKKLLRLNILQVFGILQTNVHAKLHRHEI